MQSHIIYLCLGDVWVEWRKGQLFRWRRWGWTEGGCPPSFYSPLVQRQGLQGYSHTKYNSEMYSISWIVWVWHHSVRGWVRVGFGAGWWIQLERYDNSGCSRSTRMSGVLHRLTVLLAGKKPLQVGQYHESVRYRPLSLLIKRVRHSNSNFGPTCK